MENKKQKNSESSRLNDSENDSDKKNKSNFDENDLNVKNNNNDIVLHPKSDDSINEKKVKNEDEANEAQLKKKSNKKEKKSDLNKIVENEKEFEDGKNFNEEEDLGLNIKNQIKKEKMKENDEFQPKINFNDGLERNKIKTISQINS